MRPAQVIALFAGLSAALSWEGAFEDAAAKAVQGIENVERLFRRQDEGGGMSRSSDALFLVGTTEANGEQTPLRARRPPHQQDKPAQRHEQARQQAAEAQSRAALAPRAAHEHPGTQKNLELQQANSVSILERHQAESQCKPPAHSMARNSTKSAIG